MIRAALLVFLALPSAALAAPASADPVADAAAEVRANHPQDAARIDAIQPALDRSGAARFVGMEADHRFASLHLQQALDDGLDLNVRQAHARFAAQAGLDADLMNHAIGVAPASVRSALYSGMLRTDLKDASRFLAEALSDEDLSVREAAISVLGRRPDARNFGAALAQATSDEAVSVRKMAVRALGWHGLTAQKPAVIALLTDVSADVRVASLRALRRLDPTAASAQASRMANDVDPRVRAEVQRALIP
ncbi:MAG: HEAT repeat domain-containing protein [Myxococcota bacterium]